MSQQSQHFQSFAKILRFSIARWLHLGKQYLEVKTLQIAFLALNRDEGHYAASPCFYVLLIVVTKGCAVS